MSEKPTSNDKKQDFVGLEPPFSLENEVVALGAIIFGGMEKVISQVEGWLEPHHFYRKDHQVIYSHLLQIHRDDIPIDLVILRDRLKQSGELDAVGGLDYLQSLGEATPSTANLVHYAGRVRDCYLKRELIRTGNQVASLGYDPATPAMESLMDAEQKIFKLGQHVVTSNTSTSAEIIPILMKDIQRRRDGGVRGLRTGFQELDEMVHGLARGELTVLGARASMGKTSLALNIVEYITCDSSMNVGIFSMEMSAVTLMERLLASRSSITCEQLQRGIDANWPKFEQLESASTELQATGIFIEDCPSLTPTELKARARRLYTRHGLDLIVVDYLQLMHAPGVRDRYVEIGQISHALKALARDLNVPVLALSQLNRAPDARSDNRPRLSDLRESGDVEQDADVVMLLYREDYYQSELGDKEPSNMAELIVAKNRNGPTGKINLVWDAPMMTFRDAFAGKGVI